MPTALSGGTQWLPIVAFVLGGAFFLAVDGAIDTVNRRFGRAVGDDTGPWVVYFGVAMDSCPTA